MNDHQHSTSKTVRLIGYIAIVIVLTGILRIVFDPEIVVGYKIAVTLLGFGAIGWRLADDLRSAKRRGRG